MNNKNKINNSLSNIEILKDHLNSEIQSDLAVEFLKSVKSEEELVRTYEHLGELWAPLILGWYDDWLMKQNPVNPKIMMRDGKILTFNKDFKKLYLNRKNMGLEDVFDPTTGNGIKVEDNLIIKYLKQEDAYDKYFTFIDSGCWGTIIFKLKTQEHFKNMSFQPLFFFSHNSYIRGFLNELKEKGFLEDNEKNEFCELLNDSLESTFLNYEKRTSKFEEKNGRVYPILERENDFVADLGKKALNSLFKEIAKILRLSEADKVRMFNEGLTSKELSKYLSKINIVLLIQDGIHALWKAHNDARNGDFTGILPRHSETSKTGPKMLKEWGKQMPLFIYNIEKVKDYQKIIDQYNLILSMKHLQKIDSELKCRMNIAKKQTSQEL